MKKILGLGLTGFFGLWIWGQETAEVPIFRVSSDQVLVEFIAIDKEGRFVTDLRPEELELRVDGKEHPIERLIRPDASLSAAVVTPGEAAVGASPGSGAAATEGSVAARPARTVILIDTRVFDSSNFSHSVRAIHSFIGESLQSRHLVMLAQIDRGLEILIPFTDDREKLLEAVDTLRPVSVYNPLDPSRLTAGLGERYFQDLQQQIVYLRGGLKLLCQSLSGFPGRKHVVFFSEGYPLKPIKDLEILSRTGAAFASADTRQAASREVGSRQDTEVLPMVQEVVALANSYGITFYTIDARGLVAAQGFGDAATRDQAEILPTGPGVPQSGIGRGTEPPGGGIPTPPTGSAVSVNAFQLTNLSNLDDGQNTLLALAAGTNGSAFFNTNDLEAVLRASTLEQRFAYLLSFDPKQKGKPKFHNVKIKTKRDNVIVRSQVGFHDINQQDLVNLRLATAFERPDLFQHLSPLIQFQPNSGNRQVVVGVPGSQITGRKSGEQYEIEVAFVGQVYDEKSKPVGGKPQIARIFKVGVSSEQFQSLANQPLLANEELKLKPGKYKLILVVLDQISGTMGALSEEFRVG